MKPKYMKQFIKVVQMLINIGSTLTANIPMCFLTVMRMLRKLCLLTCNSREDDANENNKVTCDVRDDVARLQITHFGKTNPLPNIVIMVPGVV